LHHGPRVQAVRSKVSCLKFLEKQAQKNLI
jgi:hypothetical protein